MQNARHPGVNGLISGIGAGWCIIFAHNQCNCAQMHRGVNFFLITRHRVTDLLASALDVPLTNIATIEQKNLACKFVVSQPSLMFR